MNSIAGRHDKIGKERQPRHAHDLTKLSRVLGSCHLSIQNPSRPTEYWKVLVQRTGLLWKYNKIDTQSTGPGLVQAVDQPTLK